MLLKGRHTSLKGLLPDSAFRREAPGRGGDGRLSRLWDSVRDRLAGDPIVFTTTRENDPVAVYAYAADSNRWDLVEKPSPKHHNRPCFLALPPGRLALRGITLDGGKTKEAREAVILELQSSLMVASQEGWTYARARRIGGSIQAVAAWIDNALLSELAEAAGHWGLSPSRILVPEFSLGDTAPDVFIHANRDDQCVFYILEGQPVLWQAFSEGGPSLADCLELIKAQLDGQGLPLPGRNIVWVEDGLAPGPVSDVLDRTFPDLPSIRITDWPTALPLLLGKSRSARPTWFPLWDEIVFSDFLAAKDRIKLDKSHVKSLALALAAMVVGVLLLTSAVLRDAEKNLSNLEREVRHLSVEAHRSKILGDRIRQAAQSIAFIRDHTEAKPMLLEIITSIARSVPKLVKLEAISLSEQGEVRLSGKAENEFYVTELLDSLSKLKALQTPTLEALEVDPKSRSARFAIAVSAPAWREYYQALRAPDQHQQKAGKP
jgi:Tfp pilus assembly protein PilN